MTGEHLQTLLDDEHCCDLLHHAATLLARADIPGPVAEALRLRRLTALRKSNGKVRGIVTGDVFRRLVARTLAQQVGEEVEQATAPFQFALSTRAGTECVAHLVQTLTQDDPAATVVSIDGIGAFDLMSRNAMLEGLANLGRGSALLPFCRLFYGERSQYWWHDDSGQGHAIDQAEGGEQGDPLMPALFALGQHPALQQVNGILQPGERIFAFLDDVYVVTTPDRARFLFNAVRDALQAHCGISVNMGKTRVWNRGGQEPPGIRELGSAEDRAWVGGADTPPEAQGLVVLGAPIGH